MLQQIGNERQSLHGAVTAVRRVVDIGRPWLRFLGWWRAPTVAFLYQSQIDQHVAWMRDERGFARSTVEQWSRTIGSFLRWCEQTNRRLGDLRAQDLDDYFGTRGIDRRSRVSVASTASALRGFLRYAAIQGICADHLAASIYRPRLYQQESLPYAPRWADVERMLADIDTEKARDIRDRAILLLLAVYGMRSGEVAALRLDQIDWAGRTLRLFRLKRRQPQIYPLVPSVAEGLARYIDIVRPPSACREVFLCMQAPRRPLKAGSIYDVANRRFVALGITTARTDRPASIGISSAPHDRPQWTWSCHVHGRPQGADDRGSAANLVDAKARFKKAWTRIRASLTEQVIADARQIAAISAEALARYDRRHGR